MRSQKMQFATASPPLPAPPLSNAYKMLNKWLPRLSEMASSMGTPSGSPTGSPVAAAFDTTSNAPGSLRDAHNAAGAWFLGPKAENGEYFQRQVRVILEDLFKCRREFAPEDKKFIDSAMVSSQAFKDSMSTLETNVSFLSSLLPQHSIPFYSPRYMAHMLNDVSMPATLGYLMALMYNPNNVAVEGSPLTSVIEFDVGQQLCSMLGYDVQMPGRSPILGPSAWGHITCDGSVANMESMCTVARNLKFYPLSLKRAVDNDPSLAYMASHFKVKLCTGKEKLLIDCEPWDLLNLTPDEVVSLPTRLEKQFGLSPQSLQAIMGQYIIQTTGKDDLEKYFDIQKPIQYLVSKTTHYSWPKGAAITGIGSTNLIGVPVDDQARMDCQALDMLLAECVKHRQAVYAIVAIMGTTEHGTVDPLSKILALRRKYQRRGLSFMVHADGAWGGYFTSMLVPNPNDKAGAGESLDDPTLFLHPYTRNELRHLRYADSITIDPHKSGYVPYPAGSLCYRDGRFRYLVTWTSPVIDSPEDGANRMGVYGIEGSKPGAAPVAAWLGHEVIGLHKGGYGFLLGEAVFTGIKMYGHWATMSLDHPNLLVVPFRMLPSEKSATPSAKEVDEERRYIRDFILTRTREELANDPRATALLRQMGSDLVVNAFACNFRVNGKVNKDIDEANYLNARIYEKLSFHKLSDSLNDRKVIVMSTVFSQKEYGACLMNFKERLGLSGDGNLVVLVNVSMSPFASPINFEKVLADAFRETAEEEVKVSLTRNIAAPALHAFVVQGTDPVHLVHLPCFSSASQRRQCILSGDMPESDRLAYMAAKVADPTAIYLATTVDAEDLSTVVQRKSLRILISKLTATGSQSIVETQLTHITAIKNRHLHSRYLDSSYPSKMPFYLYGTLEEIHIDHMLLRAPNALLTASDVTVELADGDRTSFAAGLKKGLIAVVESIPEHLMQPYTSDHKPDFFQPGLKVDITIYHDRRTAQSQGPGLADNLGTPIARGTLTLGDSIFVDSTMLNVDTPIVATHVPKKKIIYPVSDDASSQDHPYFRGYGPAGFSALGTPGFRHGGGWRDIWDSALAARNLGKLTAIPSLEDEPGSDYCPSPVVVRSSQIPIFH
ncbi:pyridoxal-dependent decarboxylase domain protein [Artomyces pyxidatus]|uniref:Pyridoxal-dependent decarboxylase domain protein n=1 Tax=Artomyces pyxidatus TaxID=48021 RepID=A0ACB8SVP6_9AGAM|nr:pyridoxal-dependent decarboxylase domain protein [Artomyces pyxidatus]